MLHLVLESEANDAEDFIGVTASRKLLDKPRHLLIDVRAILSGFCHRGPGTRAALRPLNSWSEPFVVGIEEEKKVFRVRVVSRLEFLQHSFKEPARVSDMPARR